MLGGTLTQRDPCPSQPDKLPCAFRAPCRQLPVAVCGICWVRRKLKIAGGCLSEARLGGHWESQHPFLVKTGQDCPGPETNGQTASGEDGCFFFEKYFLLGGFKEKKGTTTKIRGSDSYFETHPYWCWVLSVSLFRGLIFYPCDNREPR